MKGLLKIIFCSIIAVFVAGCDGGGDGEGGQGGYSVALSANEVQLNVAYGDDHSDFRGSASVQINFTGDGLVVGYPPGAPPDENLQVNLVLNSISSATLVLNYFSGSHYPRTTSLQRTLRVATGDAAGIQVVYQDLKVNIHLEDGLLVSQEEVTASPETPRASIGVDTLALNWQASTDTPWIVLEQASGNGPGLISFSYDFSKAPPGLSSGSILVQATASDGNVITRTRTINMNNGIEVRSDQLYVEGEWGASFQPLTVQVMTHLTDWTLQSSLPGVTFEPASGSGSAAVAVNIDSTKLNVYSNELIVTASSQGQTDNVVLGVYAGMPRVTTADGYSLDGHSRTHWTSISYSRDIFGASQSQTLHYQLVNGGLAPWRVSGLPEWLTVNKKTGFSSEPLLISINDQAVVEGQTVAEFTLTLDIPGEPFTVTVTAIANVEHFKLDPVRHAFAFSSHGTSGIQSGTIDFRRMSGLPEQAMQSLLLAESSHSWLVVDSASLAGVDFHLETDQLSDGFHVAAVTLSSETNALIAPATVYVGYYQSSEPVAPVVPLDGPFLRDGLQSPLGPWTYFTRGGAGAEEVLVFNNHTGAFESPIQFSTASSVGKILITDDGNRLLMHDVNQERIYIYNLLTGEHEPYWDNVFSSFPWRFYRLNGHAVFDNALSWFNFDTRTRITVEHLSNSASIDEFVALAGEGILTGSAFDCGVNYVPLHYSRSRAHATVGAAVPAIGGCSTIPFVLSANQKLLASHSYNTNKVTRYELRSDATVVFQADAQLESGLNPVGLAVTDAGEVIVAIVTESTDFLRIYSANLTDYRTVGLEEFRSISSLFGVQLSSDGKNFIYVDADATYERAKAVSLPVSAP